MAGYICPECLGTMKSHVNTSDERPGEKIDRIYYHCTGECKRDFIRTIRFIDGEKKSDELEEIDNVHSTR